MEKKVLQTVVGVTSTYDNNDKVLSSETEVLVRFNEADPLGIVWHGHYLRYFEDGREAFGRQHGISYLDCQRNGVAAPVVSVQCEYAKPLRYGDKVKVQTTFINSRAAKLIFEYRVFDAATEALVARGSSVQVFVDIDSFELRLTLPPFVEAWKKQQNLG